jgi:hypothetical protein
VTGRLLLLLAATATLAANLHAQTFDPRVRPPWVDTTGESGVYPNGDAVDVYRAALDLLYIDGNKRPSVIVLHDTVEIRGGDGPCPVACKQAWPHKSRIDTSAILAFARVSPKRPRVRQFDYSIPIVLWSYNDREQMRHDGIGYIAEHNLHENLPGVEQRIGFALKYPGAWGLTELTKVGFNTQHTQALVQIRHWCGESCASSEILFLKRISGRWRVIERIPSYAEANGAKGNLRYRGPAGSRPSESEIVSNESTQPIARSDSRDAAAVYRAVLDSLYSFQGDAPKMIVLTDRYRNPEDSLSALRTQLDSGVLQKYAFLGMARATPDRAFTYRLPVRIVLGDSMSRLEKVGAAFAQQNAMNPALWFGFRKEFPGAWGMVGFSRVAFNLPHTQALVFSSHQCGEYCGHGDTWVLKRRGDTWRVVQRIPRTKYPEWEPALFPLRYVGLDAKPNAYHQRRAYAVFTNAVTNRPLSFLEVSGFRNGNQSEVYTADSAGRVDLGTIPFTGIVGMKVGCPDQSSPDSLYALEFLFSPGSDTTLNTQIDFRECLRTSESHRLTGAQAFISPTEARFVFPFRPPTESWDLPLRHTIPGTTDYFWMVDWRDAESDRDDPVELWLRASQQPNGPRISSLAELASRSTLEAMIECGSCDQPAVFANPKTDHKNVIARVESGRITFVVRGRDAVRNVFPRVPRAVSFSTMVRHTPSGKNTSSDIEESQRVVVNCHSSDSTGASRRRCDAPTNSRFATPAIGSTADRQVEVVAISYDGASLMRNLDVRVRSEDRKTPPVTLSTGQSGHFSILQPSPDSVAIEAVCPSNTRRQSNISGRLSLYLAPGRDTTLQLLVDQRRCSDTAGGAGALRR